MTDYTVIERARAVAARSDRILPLLVDYHLWRLWSPWEDLDPDLTRSYSGPGSGVGTVYEWSGNRKAGAGRMEVTSVSATAVEMDLDFVKPFKSAGKTKFDLVPDEDVTKVTWRVLTPKTWMTRIAGLFMNFDKSVGGDLERGLAKLKAQVEKPAT